MFTGRDEKTQFWEMSDEELVRLRAEKKENKRNVFAGFVDPFHLWGSRGYIGKHLTGKKKDANSPATQVKDASTKSSA